MQNTIKHSYWSEVEGKWTVSVSWTHFTSHPGGFFKSNRLNCLLCKIFCYSAIIFIYSVTFRRLRKQTRPIFLIVSSLHYWSLPRVSAWHISWLDRSGGKIHQISFKVPFLDVCRMCFLELLQDLASHQNGVIFSYFHWNKNGPLFTWNLPFIVRVRKAHQVIWSEDWEWFCFSCFWRQVSFWFYILRNWSAANNNGGNAAFQPADRSSIHLHYRITTGLHYKQDFQVPSTFKTRWCFFSINISALLVTMKK